MNHAKHRLGMLERIRWWWRRIKPLLSIYEEQNLREWRYWGTRRAIKGLKTLGCDWKKEAKETGGEDFKDKR